MNVKESDDGVIRSAEGEGYSFSLEGDSYVVRAKQDGGRVWRFHQSDRVLAWLRYQELERDFQLGSRHPHTPKTRRESPGSKMRIKESDDGVIRSAGGEGYTFSLEGDSYVVRAKQDRGRAWRFHQSDRVLAWLRYQELERDFETRVTEGQSPPESPMRTAPELSQRPAATPPAATPPAAAPPKESRRARPRPPEVHRPARSPRQRPEQRPRLRWPAIAALALVACAGLATLSAVKALRLRSDLIDARAALDRGRAQLFSEDFSSSSQSFRAAQSDFRRAETLARSPLLLGPVPVLGRTADAVVGLSDGGQLVARAGIELAGAIEALPQGLDSLMPAGGTVSLETLRTLETVAGQAEGLVAAAVAQTQGTPDSMLLPAVSRARLDALRMLSSVRGTLTMARTILGVLPTFLGDRGTKRYFFAAQDPAELRGTGGRIAAYSILAVSDGRLTVSRFRSPPALPVGGGGSQIQALSRSPSSGSVRALNDWRAINLSPNLSPTRAGIERLYRQAVGTTLDGVILADPYFLQALLKVIGAVRISSLQSRVGAGNVVDFLTNEAYTTVPNDAALHAIIATVADRVIGRFLDLGRASSGAARILANAVRDGHLQVSVDDPTVEHAFTAAGAVEDLKSIPGGLLAFVQNNIGGTRVDYYEHRSIAYTVDLGESGNATVRALVRVENGAPASGKPTFVIGPTRKAPRAGESVSIGRLYCSPSCRFGRITRYGAPRRLRTGKDTGRAFAQASLRVPSGSHSEVSYKANESKAWSQDGAFGVYRLTVLDVPTIQPTLIRVSIQVPQGMRVVATSVPMVISGDHATWTGELTRRTLTFEIRFA